jgi:TatD DNase family protein
MLFDCHSHVQFSAFEKDWKEVTDRTLAGGVSIINIGTQRDTSAKAVEIANLYETGVYATVALHPVHTSKSFHDSQELGGGEFAKSFTSRGEEFDYEYYLSLARDKKVVGIGECGLDYFRSPNDESGMTNDEWKEKQKDVFLQHVKIAQEVGKALMIHCRPSKGTDDAYEDLLSILHNSNFLLPRVLHFYVGSPAMTKKFLDAGFNFEFGGVITFARSYDEQIKSIPLDRILTETDSPYVAPEPHRGERNEPLYVKEVAKKLAEIKGVSYDEIERVTSENARRIFRI